MAENSKIEWTDHTFNPWMGCQRVSAGCDHCYAETLMDTRYGRVQWGPHGARQRTSAANWRKPRQWAVAARGSDRRPRVFCASLADVFDNKAPNGAREDLWSLIRETPELDWLLLTKRPENMGKMLPPDWGHFGYANVWLGTTCEDQPTYARRWPILANTPAAVRFISYEPAIGPLFPYQERCADGMISAPDWLICGGESGTGYRNMPEEWALEALEGCKRYNIAFFMKQMAGKKPVPDHLMVRQWPESAHV